MQEGKIWVGLISLITALLCTMHAAAQVQRTISIQVRTEKSLPAGDTLFIAGNFNNWNPATTPLQFNAKDSSWFTNLQTTVTNFQYKYTRGSWGKVEVLAKGEDVLNRSFVYPSEIYDTVVAWKDDFKQLQKVSTASKNVTLLNDAFFMPQLNGERRIWIYLPPGYKASNKRYPVIYMQDGQNIFDDSTAGFGEWGVDEILDSMYTAGVGSSIVVGIASGKQRLNEYNPFNNNVYGAGMGEAYISFISYTLKPFIDSAYRTLSTASNTTIAGSSMGGLIAYYAAITKPQIFGRAGVFSPSFWIAPGLGSITENISIKVSGKFFFSIGKLEGAGYVTDMENMMDKLATHSSIISYSIITEAGEHNERAWRQTFPLFYKWIMANGANVILDTAY